MPLELPLASRQIAPDPRENSLGRHSDGLGTLLGGRRNRGGFSLESSRPSKIVRIFPQGSFSIDLPVRQAQLDTIEIIFFGSRLGMRSLARLGELAQLPDGWDFGRGKALAPETVANLLKLVAYRGVNLPTDPRLFLNPDGGLSLVWPHPDNRESMLICQPNSFVFIDVEDNEYEFPADQISRLAAALSFPA